jgi:hypothetical protein
VAGAHAILSPSGFKALMLCPAKPAMERGLADESSEYADEGTAAHFLGSWCLERDERGRRRHRLVHRPIGVDADGTTVLGRRRVSAHAEVKAHFEVTVDLAEAVQVYIEHGARLPGRRRRCSSSRRCRSTTSPARKVPRAPATP